MEKLAFVFAGVGHSYVGMGQDLYAAFAEVRETFEQVSDLTGMNIARLCFEGPASRLTRLKEGLPAQFALSLGCYRLVSARGVRPDYFCGPCAGQVMSWVATEALDLESALGVFRQVTELVNQAPVGVLARVVGLDLDAVENICRQTRPRGVVDIATIMGPQVISVSGEPSAVRMALDLAAQAGATEAAILPIELRPIHSRLVAAVSEEIIAAKQGLAFRSPRTPIISSLDGQPMYEAEELLPKFAQELSSTSNWRQAMQWLQRNSVDVFLSLGLARDIVHLVDRQAISLHVRDIETLASTLEFLWDHHRL